MRVGLRVGWRVGWQLGSRLVLLGLAWPLLACDPPELSDAGQYRLDIELEDRLGRDGHHVLVGSEFKVEISELVAGGESESESDDVVADVRACATASAEGVVGELGGRHYRVDTVGPGAVEFAPPIDVCPTNDALVELGPESLVGHRRRPG